MICGSEHGSEEREEESDSDYEDLASTSSFGWINHALRKKIVKKVR